MITTSTFEVFGNGKREVYIYFNNRQHFSYQDEICFGIQVVAKW